MKFERLSATQLADLVASGRVVEQDGRGIKVVQLPDGRYFKYFRRRRRFSKDAIISAARRFASHAQKLHELGIATVRVESIFVVAESPDSAVIYHPLEGVTLRELIDRGALDFQTMYRLGVFLARLHREGVFFRSVHPGNIIVTDTRIGLIDILDMKVRPWSVTRWARRRNWRHFLRTRECGCLTSQQVDALLEGYRDAADLPRREMGRVVSSLQAVLGESVIQ